MIRAQLMTMCDWMRATVSDVAFCEYPGDMMGTAYFGDAAGEVEAAWNARALPGINVMQSAGLPGHSQLNRYTNAYHNVYWSSAWIQLPTMGAPAPPAPVPVPLAIEGLNMDVQPSAGCGCAFNAGGGGVDGVNAVLPGVFPQTAQNGAGTSSAGVRAISGAPPASIASLEAARRFPWALVVLAVLVGMAVGTD